jgi:hypothetical protein
MSQPAYKRILLKLSGEALMGDDAYGINRGVVAGLSEEVVEVTRLGVEVGSRDWRREHLPWHGRGGIRYGSRHCRLHGDAGHRDERHGLADAMRQGSMRACSRR